MEHLIVPTHIPIPERTLRDLSKNLSKVLPNFSEKEPALGVKALHEIVGPILDTADQADLTPSHRSAACNILCAIVDKCQASDVQYAKHAVLDDFVWGRMFDIYLQRSDNAKGKSVRQLLLVLTGALLKDQNPRTIELSERTATTFIDIVCHRQDRLKVKPALQGLAHFLQKDIVKIPQLIETYSRSLGHSNGSVNSVTASSLLTRFLAWIVHHDTSLSAGHLVKNFLAQLRRSSTPEEPSNAKSTTPIWIQPVVECLQQWPDRTQEFKTHVFPHCFLPNFDEYLYFLSYLRFQHHVGYGLPHLFDSLCGERNSVEDFGEFKILLASIECGKELGIVRDFDYRECSSVHIQDGVLCLPDDIFGGWLSHNESEVRLAGLLLSIYSTAVTRPITGGIFESLKLNLGHLHTDTDTNFRRELLGYTQKLLDRLRGSTATLAKMEIKSAHLDGSRLAFPPSLFAQSGHLRKRVTQNPLTEALQFIVWYINFLEWELRSDASYQRRISALRALTIVLKSGLDPRVPHHLLSKRAQGLLHWAHGLQLANLRLIRVLLDLLLDPFDDVRDASVSVLDLCFASLSREGTQAALAMLRPFIARAEEAMLRTGRADQADGVARSYALYHLCSPKAVASNRTAPHGGQSRISILNHLNEQLKKTLDLASSNLAEAVNGRPVHGTFAAIRYIFDHESFYSDILSFSDDEFAAYKLIHIEFLTSFETLWSCIRTTLCADAPEGHVPEDMEEEANLDTKEILSYSWRGLKEASILLRTIISKAPIGTRDRSLMTPLSFERFGKLCFTQLVELRHRGAFSTVAQTFAAFCRRCVSPEDEMLRGLPEQWYQETLLSIQAKAHTITRRSGGIPSLMAAIVAAEPQPGGLLFRHAMEDLIKETLHDAESSNIEESRLPQVHALNCIKEFFTTSRLSIASEAYLGEALTLASGTLNSKVWPIRNCGLMLFKALIERLLGSDEAQDWKERDRARTSRFSYDNYPTLVEILKELLDPQGPLKKSLDTPESNSPMDLHGAEGVFPALQILRQATPPEFDRKFILHSVQALLPTPHWHLRDMAARTVTSLHSPYELIPCIKSLLAAVDGSMNSRHGALLCVKYLIKKGLQECSVQDPNFDTELILILSNWATSWYTNMRCPFTKAAFLDLAGTCGMAIIRGPSHEPNIGAWTKLTAALRIGPETTFGISDGSRGSALFRTSLVQVFLIDRAILRPDSIDIMMSPKYASIEDTLVLLARKDPDTCLAGLEALDDIIQTATPHGPLMQFSLMLLQIYHLLQDTHDQEVLTKAQSILADGLSRDGMVAGVLGLIQEESIFAMLDNFENQCLECAPSNMQSALRLMGFFLDYAYNTFSRQHRNILLRVSRYIRLLRMVMIDTNPFDARFAAAQSVSGLRYIWTLDPSSKETNSILLGLSFVLYDMLNDDDDEIRATAAAATTRLLQAQECSSFRAIVPIMAANRLAKFVVRHFPHSTELCKEALCRLIDTPMRSQLFVRPFAEVLAAQREEDTALFSTEKQNLFKDDTLDAVLWSRVLSRLPLSTIPTILRDGLTKWVLEALAAMTDTSKSEIDGALGWAAKTEVFTLGMRVICAAEVLLIWDASSSDASRVRRALREFADAGNASEVHGLWLERVEMVLQRSVVDALSYAKAGLMSAQMKLNV